MEKNSRVLLYLTFLIFVTLALVLIFDNPLQIVGIAGTLISFLIAFSVFLPRMEEKFIKSIILTIITVFINLAFGFMGFFGALFSIFSQLIALRYVAKISWFPTVVLAIIITLINFLILWGVISLEAQM